jgi:hypothetical protein
LWSDEWPEGGEQALAMLERVAVEILSSLGAGAPLLVPRARLCIVAWTGWRGDRPFEVEPLQLDAREFPGVIGAFGSPAHGVDGFARSCREALYARRVAQLTRSRPGSVTRYNDVALAALACVDAEQAREFVATELGQLANADDDSRRLTATLRVYLEENMEPAAGVPTSGRSREHDHQPRARGPRAVASSDRASLPGVADRAPLDPVDGGPVGAFHRSCF